MEQIEALKDAILDPMTTLWLELVGFAPNLISAILMLVVGYYIARFIYLQVFLL
jgi:hypothetical protein